MFHFADDAFCDVSFRNLTRRGEAVIVHSDSMAWIDPTTGVPGPVWIGGGYGLRSRYFAGWQDIMPLVGRATRVYAMRGRCSLSTTIMHRSHLKSHTDCTGFFLRGVVSRFRNSGTSLYMLNYTVPQVKRTWAWPHSTRRRFFDPKVKVAQRRPPRPWMVV